MFKLLIFFSCFSGLVYSTQIFIGDLCIHKGLNLTGSCQLISNCPRAVEDLRKNQIAPENCGFEKQQPIVCCPTGSRPADSSATLKDSDVGYRSEIKCKEYGKHVFKKVHAVSLVENGNKLVEYDTCISRVQLLIGYGVREQEFPHMAQIGVDKDGAKHYICSASLVSKDYVITAAHCLVSSSRGSAKYVRLGILSESTDQAGLQERAIEKIIVHPNFHIRKFSNDIGLAKLDKPVDFTSYVRPICLSPSPEIPANRTVTVGWPNEVSKDFRNSLEKDNIKILNLEECQSYLSGIRKNETLDDTQICAGNTFKPKTCLEIGEIMQVPNKVYCMSTLVGIKSLKLNCYNTNLEVYTNVSKYLEWIENIIWT